jgi:CubicO group peptidase (beta-lactamase class C family)
LLDDTVVEMGAPGGVLAVVDPVGHTWIGATGLADVDAQLPMDTTDRMGIGSITKTFTGAVTLQLVEEGVLSLDDPLSAYPVDFPRADEIQLRHLLTHTTGIYDYAYDSDVLAGHARNWEPEELVAIAAAYDLAFEPGDSWSYSNTNFILVGLVIEAVTGNSWAHEVRTRLLDPFDLQDTFVATDEDVPNAAHGYFGDDDWTLEVSPSTGWAAGGIVSNATDLLKWLDALIYGDVLSESSRDAMRTPSTLNNGEERGYGIGLSLRHTDQYGSFTKIGHGGDAIIYRSDLFHIPESGHTVVALVNGFPHEASLIADRVWTRLLPPIEQ